LIDPAALAFSTTVYLSNNIIYSTGEPYLAGESASLPAGNHRNCWYGAGNAPVWDTTAINANPNFANVAAANFQLQEGSPCVDAGKDVSSVVSLDLLGASRPQGLAFDIGAFEWISGTVAPQWTIHLPLVLRSSP